MKGAETFAPALILALAASCRSPVPIAGGPRPVETGAPVVASTFPSARELEAVPTPFKLHARTVMEVARGSSLVTITDTKDLSLGAAAGPSGHRDFALKSGRDHSGSESGNTHEAFSAVRIGKRYWTRGTGGPYVVWDDALHEPEETLARVLGEAGSLLRLAGECMKTTVVAGEHRLGLARTDCTASTGPTEAQMTAVFKSIDGKSSWAGRPPATLDLRMEIEVRSGGHGATVNLEHETELTPIGPEDEIEAPKGAVSSRRERPVKMVEKVLSGLVTEWGPGAPDVLKKK